MNRRPTFSLRVGETVSAQHFAGPFRATVIGPSVCSVEQPIHDGQEYAVTGEMVGEADISIDLIDGSRSDTYRVKVVPLDPSA